MYPHSTSLQTFCSKWFSVTSGITLLLLSDFMGASMSLWPVLSSSSLYTSFWCPRPSKSCLKPVECQNSTTLSSHSTGTTQSHMVIRRKLLYLNIPPFVTWLWKKGLSVFQCFTKFSRKKFFCLLAEVCFSQGTLDWVNEHNLVFLFSCLALHVCNRTLPHGPLAPVCVFLFWGISSSLLRGLLRIPENESRTWLPGHNQLQGRLRKCDLLFRVLTY